MFKLYPQQKVIYEQIQHQLIDTPFLKNIYLNKKLFISGEMGVGKTYIGTQTIINYVHNTNSFGLIFCPTTVVKKWHKVLLDAINTYNYPIKVKELKRNNKFIKTSNTTKAKTDVSFEPNTIYIITNNSLNVFVTNNYGFFMDLSKLPLIIFDEVHELKGAKIHGLEQLLRWDNNKMNVLLDSDLITSYSQFYDGTFDKKLNNKIPMLFLTGTIFNKSWNDIFELIALTHQLLLKHAVLNLDCTDLVKNNLYDFPIYHKFKFLTDPKDIRSTFPNIFVFINKIWQYISISLSLDDVKKTNKINNKENEINQTIMPIKPFPLTNEQQMFLNVARIQLARLNTSNIETKIMDWIDYPTKSLILQKKPHVRKTRFTTNKQEFVSFPLIPISLNHTVKYKKLQEIIQAKYENNKRFLIYANDPDLITALVKLLSKNYKTFSLPMNLKAKEYGEYIKEQFTNGYEIGVVQPTKINVGIDIEADYLIWYQLINDYSKMLQATRRVYRLSSTRESLVYFLIYENTQQEEIVNELSNSTKNNAATYGEQSQDNLTKITGILLDNI